MSILPPHCIRGFPTRRRIVGGAARPNSAPDYRTSAGGVPVPIIPVPQASSGGGAPHASFKRSGQCFQLAVPCHFYIRIQAHISIKEPISARSVRENTTK